MPPSLQGEPRRHVREYTLGSNQYLRGYGAGQCVYGASKSTGHGLFWAPGTGWPLYMKHEIQVHSSTFSSTFCIFQVLNIGINFMISHNILRVKNWLPSKSVENAL